MRHVVESQQFTKETLESLFREADMLSKPNTEEPLRGRILASLFYEPSTRTRFSFEAAMKRLGGEVISTESAKEFSSAAKGETLEDSIRVMSQYVDIIVLRHSDKGASERASIVSEVPIINAGDGAGQHPTQALLDLYTIQKELGKIDGIHIALMGDLKYGRTIHSLSYLLGKYRDVHITFVSPKALQVPDDIKGYLDRHKTKYDEIEEFDEVLGQADIVYQTRIQKERFASQKEYEKYKGRYVITMDEVEKMKKGAVLMHPLPRVGEIASAVDASPKAAYFRQARYGLYIRMALLKWLLVG